MARRMIILCALIFLIVNAKAQTAYQEQYRPQIHFSPISGWMNDPNGLVYFQGEYHLFFQYYPDSIVWGPMHWGHAVSKNLVEWKQVDIALYPDKLGYIFSGSAVADADNTSGFGQKGKTPLVAIYTQHDPAGETAKTNSYQNQSIAYSIDAGKNWSKYTGNPVLKTPGLPDFRDPKVIWYAAGKEWIMTLAAGDRIMFFSSKNLKEWSKESEFGAGIGAHGGVWECPDLIPFKINGTETWLLFVSINPGGIQGGSGTQYFTGSFDGHQFIPSDTATRWADYGPDNYAGVTFSNTGNDHIFLGWMSNWKYGTKVPATTWRSSMTIPRTLTLKKLTSGNFTAMMPVPEMEKLVVKSKMYDRIPEVNSITLDGPSRLEFTVPDLHAFSIAFSNNSNQQLKIGYDEIKNAFYIDRSLAGRADFDSSFPTIHYGPRIAETNSSKITIILDNTSAELFADDGLTTMTEIFFPDQPFNALQSGPGYKPVNDIKVSTLKSIWH